MNKNIYYLATSNLVLRVIAQGLLPLYALLIKEDSITKLQMGYFLAGGYLFTFLGTWFSGIAIDWKWSLKKMLQFTYIPICIGFVAMGYQKNYLHLFYFTGFTSFFNGINLNVSSIILGKFSDTKTIAKNFAWISAGSAMATLLGGLIVGPALHWYGNAIGFTFFSALVALSSIFSFLIDTPKETQLSHQPKIKMIYSKPLLYLLLATFLSNLLLHFFKISLTLKLKEAGYSIQQVSFFSTLGTIFIVPIPFLLSYLHKKYTSKLLLGSTYICTIFSFVLIYFFTKDLTVVIAITFINTLAYASRTPLIALLHQLVDELHFPKTQTLFGSISWLSAIFGYLLAGNILNKFGFTITFFVGGFIAVVATFILFINVKEKASFALFCGTRTKL